MALGVRQRRDEVLLLPHQPLDGERVERRLPQRHHQLGQPGDGTIPGHHRLPRCPETFQTVGPDRPQLMETRLARYPFHQRLRGQLAHDLPHPCKVRAERRSSVDVEPAGKHRDPAEHHLFRGGEQEMAPLHGRPQLAMSRRRSPVARDQQPELIVHSGQNVRERQRAHPPGGQLDRQRQPVQSQADLPHERVGGEVGIGCGRPIDEEAPGVLFRQPADPQHVLERHS